MQAQTPNLPAPDSAFEVRLIDAGTLDQKSVRSNQVRHWCQRHSFLRNAAFFLQVVGAFCNNELIAYMVVFPQQSHTFVLDLVSADCSLPAGYELLRWLSLNHRAPYIATYVFEQSYAFQLLTAAGFREQRRLSTLYRNLRTTCRANAS
jgi:hypothetical protein